MSPVGEFRIPDAEGESLRLADAGETLRLQYHRVTHLWRATAKTVHRRGKPLQLKGAISQVSGTEFKPIGFLCPFFSAPGMGAV